MVNNNICLCLCTLEGLSKRAVDSLIVTSHSGLIRSYITVEGTLLPQARNKLIQYCYDNNPDFTHVIMVDADMCNYDGSHIQQLLKNNMDIVSAAVVNRKPPYRIIAKFPDNDFETVKGYFQRGETIETEYVGMAFTLITKRVFDKLREETPEGPIWYHHDRNPRDTFETEISDFLLQNKNKSLKELIPDAIALGQTSHIGTSFIGEDIGFCTRAKKLGFKIHVDCSVMVGHLDINPVTPEVLIHDEPQEQKLRIIGADDE